MHYPLFYKYKAHWLLLYWGLITRLSYAIVDFYLYNDCDIEMQIWVLLTRNLGKVSATQVTVKTRGPLVHQDVFYYKLMMNWPVIYTTRGNAESLVYGHYKKAMLFFFIPWFIM